jgi:hypothetical protein
LTTLLATMLAVLMKTQLLPFQMSQQLIRGLHRLKEWHWSFSTLVKQWLTFKDGQQGMRSAGKRTDLLRVLLIEDAETTYRELQIRSMELATTFVVNGIRGEFVTLRDTIVFRRWDPELDFEQLNLSKAATKLQSEASLFTYLITELAQNQRESDNSYKR